jgi:3-oxoadipate enol-lactonase
MTVRIADIEVAYDEWGAGEPVVLVHGLAQDKSSWGAVRDALDSARCYAYDLRGHGETTPGEGEGTLEQLAADLIGFLESVTGPARCVGYSLGGTIVLKAATLRPDLVRHAVVSGTSSVVGRAAVAFFDQRIEMLENDRTAFAAGLKSDTEAQIVTGGKDLDAMAKTRLEAVGEGHGYINAARAMQRVNGEPLTPGLKDIQCRVDVIGGDRDAFCPRKAADIMLAELVDAAYHELAECGHLMTVDQPIEYGDLLAQAIRTKIR